MQQVIQIPLYPRPTADTGRLAFGLAVRLLLIAGLTAAVYRLVPPRSPGWWYAIAYCVALGWWLWSYHYHFFPSPRATLVLAYGELRILQSGQVELFLETPRHRAELRTHGAYLVLYLGEHSYVQVSIAYRARGATPTADLPAHYFIYHQADWHRLLQTFGFPVDAAAVPTVSAALPTSNAPNALSTAKNLNE